jgi:hypothetical protein
MKTPLLATATLLGMSILWVAGASAAPIYVGYAVDGSLIATVDAGSSGWYNSNGIITVGPGLYISTAITCTSPSPEPDLLSTSVDFSGSPSTTTNTINIYVTELNQETPAFSALESTFTSALDPGVPLPGGHHAVQMVESTYVTTCTNVVNNGCLASDAFAMGTLLSTTTFSPIGNAVTDVVSRPSNLAIPFVTTEVFSTTFASQYGDLDLSIDVVGVPEPASLGLLGTMIASRSAAAQPDVISNSPDATLLKVFRSNAESISLLFCAGPEVIVT